MSIVFLIIQAIWHENRLKKKLKFLFGIRGIQIISLYVTINYFMHSFFGITILAIQLILFIFSMLPFSVAIMDSIYTDFFLFIKPYRHFWVNRPRLILQSNDQGPRPSTSAQDNKVTFYWNIFHQIILEDTYSTHYKQNQNVDICSICCEKFTNNDIYGENIYITHCSHLYHRECLWKHYMYQCPNRQDLYTRCPNCNQWMHFDFQINLYDPMYITAHFDSIILAAKLDTNPFPDPINWFIEHIKKINCKTISSWIASNSERFGDYPSNLYGVH